MDEIFDIFDVLDSARDLADVGDIADISELASALDAFDFTEFDGDMFQEILNLDIGDSAGMVDDFQADYLSESLFSSIDADDMSSMLEYSNINFDGVDNIEDVYRCAAEMVEFNPFTLTADPDVLIQDALDKIPDTFMQGPYSHGAYSDIIYHDHISSDNTLGFIEPNTGNITLYDNANTVQETLWHEVAHGHFINNDMANNKLMGASLFDDPMTDLAGESMQPYYALNYTPDQIPGEVNANMFSEYMSKRNLFQQIRPNAFQVLESMKGMQA